MTRDVVAAVHALEASDLPTLDEEQVALVGHSLGGLLAINVIAGAPGLTDAAVALAPSGTDPFANVERFLSPGDPFYDELVEARGTPRTPPGAGADGGRLARSGSRHRAPDATGRGPRVRGTLARGNGRDPRVS